MAMGCLLIVGPCPSLPGTGAMHYYIVHLALWLWSVISYCGKYMEETRAQDGLTIIVAISIFLVLLKTSEFFQVLERLKDNALHPPPALPLPQAQLSFCLLSRLFRQVLTGLPPSDLALFNSFCTLQPERSF